jgi:hypothetical protein
MPLASRVGRLVGRELDVHLLLIAPRFAPFAKLLKLSLSSVADELVPSQTR